MSIGESSLVFLVPDRVVRRCEWASRSPVPLLLTARRTRKKDNGVIWLGCRSGSASYLLLCRTAFCSRALCSCWPPLPPLPTNAMSDHPNNNKTARNVQRVDGSPVILVPATAVAQGQAAVANNNDEMPIHAPTAATRTYAQVVAPPRGAPNVPASFATPPNAANRGFPLQNAQARTDATVSATMRFSFNAVDTARYPFPVQMVRSQVRCSQLMLNLPQRAETGAVNTSEANALTPTASSPISVPTTVASTQVPGGASNALDVDALTLGNASQPNPDSYEAFWADFDTRIIPVVNLPSALQSALQPARNAADTTADATWTRTATLGEETLSTATAGNANTHPTVNDPSHPPVAGRLRERKRGTSPAQGERARKSTKRKGKGKATDASPRSNTLLSNPRAASVAGTSQTNTPRVHVRSPFSIAMWSLPSMHHIPYSDFLRPASTTTTFYNRMNASGSYPTPHRLTVSPLAQEDMPRNGPPLPRRPTSRTASTSAVPARLSGQQDSLYMANVEQLAGRTRRRDLSLPISSAPPSSRDASMDHAPLQGELFTFDRRQASCENVPVSRLIDSLSQLYRSPTIEDILEERELESERRARVRSAFEWGPNVSQMRSTARSCPANLSRAHDDPVSEDNDDTTAEDEHARLRPSSSFAPHANSRRRFAEE